MQCIVHVRDQGDAQMLAPASQHYRCTRPRVTSTGHAQLPQDDEQARASHIRHEPQIVVFPMKSPKPLGSHEPKCCCHFWT